MATLAEIRAKLQAQDNRKTTSSGDNVIYPHWNIPEGAEVVLRFLPDGNTKNDYFWQERAMIRLPFKGIKGQMDSKPVMVQVPCVEMWGDTCPVLSEVRTWFKDKSLEEMGRKYWKKRSYVFQGFVRENPMTEDSAPENPIRRFIISPQLFTLVKSALLDPEIEEFPTDYKRGLDFRIVKGTKGGYADYGTSKWARKESALSATELAAIDQHGLFNLNDFLPKKPSDTELAVIKSMFEDSVDGQPYDSDKYSAYFRPAGVSAGAAPSAPEAKAQEVQAAPTPSFDEDDEPVATAAVTTPAKPAGESKKAEDILAMIRNRQKS